MRTRIVLATLAVAAGGLLAAPSEGAAPAPSPCVGAAAQDTVRPCVNATLAVDPPPTKVQKLGPSFCFPARNVDTIHELCTFGVRSRRSKAHIALLGDSHAQAWRAAVDGMAKAQRWHAYSLTAPGCFYSDAVSATPVGVREPCEDWFAWAQGWLRRNKQVSILFLAQRADTDVEVRTGQTYLSVRVAGAKRAWRRLPRNIKHVVVIRDPPRAPKDVIECVTNAVRAKVDAAAACPIPAKDAILRDTAVSTVRALRSKRYQAVDLTEFFCRGDFCRAVIGGVLVYRDPDHITPAYSKTLAPYLLRKVRALARNW